MKKLKNLAINLAVTAGTLILAITAAEIGLRIAGIEQPPPPRPGENFQPTPLYNFTDPYRGWGGNPNTKSVWTGEGRHGEVAMNNGGFRDRDRTKEKPENGFRVALLGDSFTEAIHVKLEDTYAAVMERKLNQCSALQGREVEVLNFGVQGYSTAQELMTLRHHVWDYSPDMVILAFYAGNDLRNNYRPFEHDFLRPFFAYENGKLVEDMSFRDLEHWQRDAYAFSVIDWLPISLVRNSRILQLIRKVEIERKMRQLQKDYEEMNFQFYREPAPGSDWEEAWKVSEGLIKLMGDEVKEKNADFMVTTISDSFQVLPNLQWTDDFRAANNLPNLFYADTRIREFGAQEGIPVYNLAGPLWDEAKATGKCLHGFDNALTCGGHWNEDGHRVVGEILAEYLCKKYSDE